MKDRRGSGWNFLARVWVTAAKQNQSIGTWCGSVLRRSTWNHQSLMLCGRVQVRPLTGKNWFQFIAHSPTVGHEYEPGHFRALLSPDPAEITRTMAAAADLTMYGVMRFVSRAGYDPNPLSTSAYARLVSETPLKGGSGPGGAEGYQSVSPAFDVLP